MKRTKTRNWLLATMCMMAMSAGMTACGGDDDGIMPEQTEQKKPEHTPVESVFSQALKSYSVSGMDYEKQQLVSKISMHSEAKSGKDATDRWVISAYMANDPGRDKWSGTYQLDQVWGTLYGFEKGYEVTKATLDGSNTVPAEGAYIQFEYLNEENQYGQKKYKVTLHVDELKESNGDYTRNINITYTGYIDGGMLTY